MPNVDELLSGARDAITAKRVYADPIEADNVTVVPSAAVAVEAATRRTTVVADSGSEQGRSGRG